MVPNVLTIKLENSETPLIFHVPHIKIEWQVLATLVSKIFWHKNKKPKVAQKENNHRSFASTYIQRNHEIYKRKISVSKQKRCFNKVYQQRYFS